MYKCVMVSNTGWSWWEFGLKSVGHCWWRHLFFYYSLELVKSLELRMCCWFKVSWFDVSYIWFLNFFNFPIYCDLLTMDNLRWNVWLGCSSHCRISLRNLISWMVLFIRAQHHTKSHHTPSEERENKFTYL